MWEEWAVYTVTMTTQQKHTEAQSPSEYRPGPPETSGKAHETDPTFTET